MSDAPGNFGRAFNVSDKPLRIIVPESRQITLIMDDGSGVNTAEGDAAITAEGGGRLVIFSKAGETVNIINSGEAKTDKGKATGYPWAIYTQDSYVAVGGNGTINLQGAGGIYQGTGIFALNSGKTGTINIKAKRYAIYHEGSGATLKVSGNGTITAETSEASGQCIHFAGTSQPQAASKDVFADLIFTEQFIFNGGKGSRFYIKNTCTDGLSEPLFLVRNAKADFNGGTDSHLEFYIENPNAQGIIVDKYGEAEIGGSGETVFGTEDKMMNMAVEVALFGRLFFNGTSSSSVNIAAFGTGIANGGLTKFVHDGVINIVRSYEADGIANTSIMGDAQPRLLTFDGSEDSKIYFKTKSKKDGEKYITTSGDISNSGRAEINSGNVVCSRIFTSIGGLAGGYFNINGGKVKVVPSVITESGKMIINEENESAVSIWGLGGNIGEFFINGGTVDVEHYSADRSAFFVDMDYDKNTIQFHGGATTVTAPNGNFFNKDAYTLYGGSLFLSYQ